VRILVVHQYYLGPGEPGGSRFNELARVWTGSGHEVTVIAGNLNYATGRPTVGGGRWVSRHEEDGIDVWRCHVPSTYNRGYAGRMWAFFGAALSASWAALRAPRPDVVIATSPPLTAAVPGFIAARRPWRRVPLVFEIRDLWPESAITTGVIGRDSAIARLLYALERFACTRADAVNVLTPAFGDDLKRRGLVADDRLLFVPNGADVDAFRPGLRDNEARRELQWGDRFVALYAGAHGRANALGQLIEAAEHLRHRPDILVATVGDGPERPGLELEARRRKLTNVQFVGAVGKERMPALVSAADAGLAVLQNNPTFRTVYPNKVFDYMACARPTILAIDGIARRLACDEAQAAVFVEPENGAALAEAIERLADDPQTARALGERGRTWVVAHAARQALAQQYLRALESLADGSFAASTQHVGRERPSGRASSPADVGTA
jgi:glycosyltransferase involved in cell wall biosynthesis